MHILESLENAETIVRRVSEVTKDMVHACDERGADR